jgi:hypothetical protein
MTKHVFLQLPADLCDRGDHRPVLTDPARIIVAPGGFLRLISRSAAPALVWRGPGRDSFVEGAPKPSSIVELRGRGKEHWQNGDAPAHFERERAVRHPS